MIGNLLPETFLQAMGWTLLHFLWQGMVVAGLLAAVNRMLKNHPANSRYVAACASLLVMFAFPMATLYILTISFSADHAGITTSAISLATKHTAAFQTTGEMIRDWSGRFSNIAPWLTSGWFAGVLLLSFRMFGGWMHTRQLKKKYTNALADHWQKRFASLCREIRISRPVRILESALVPAPMVIGWIRPVILIPASALTGLTPQQLETIIFHELAHVCRYDYLVNLAQSVIEILLFYHPAVWWVSRQIRAERENCCDDWALERCGDGITYARALTEIEILRQVSPQLAMGIDGGSLLKRIQRIVGEPAQAQGRSGSWIAGVIALATMVTLVTGAKIPVFPDNTMEKSEAVTAPAAPNSKKLGFISGMASVGYTNLTVDELIALKDHDVTPEFIRKLQSAGFAHPDIEELIRTRDHGVDPQFIQSIQVLGYEKLTLDEFIRIKDHGVDGDFIQKAKSGGFKNLTIDQIIRLRDAGVLDEADFGGNGI